MTSKRRKRRQRGKRKEQIRLDAIGGIKVWQRLNDVHKPPKEKSVWDGLVQSIVGVQPWPGLSYKQLYLNEWTADERNENTNNPP